MTTSEESRAVLTAMGCYVLTAASLVAWVIYELFRRTPKVLSASCYVSRPGSFYGSAWACLQVQSIRQLQDKAVFQPGVADSDSVFEVIKSRRSVFPKDYTGQLVSRYFYQCTIALCLNRSTQSVHETLLFLLVRDRFCTLTAASCANASLLLTKPRSFPVPVTHR